MEIQQTGGLSVSVATAGAFILELRDLMGRPIASRAGKGPSPVSLDGAKHAGIYLLSVKTEAGIQVLKLVRN